MVILSNPCGRTGEIIQESLNSHGIETVSVIGPSPKRNAPGYLKALLEAEEKYRPEMIIPIFFPEVLAHYRDRFSIPILCETEEKLRLLDNKRSACELARKLNIPQPVQYSNLEEIKDYPVVFKRCFGQGGDSVYFPKTEKSLTNILKTASDYLITEYIEGSNYSVDAIRWDDFFFATSYKVLEPTGKGVSTLRVSVSCPELEDYARKMMDAVDYSGVCGFDFRVRKSDDKAFFLECNPRFSGGVESSIKSGFDIPYLLFKFAKGQEVTAGEISFVPGILTGESI